MHKRLTIFFVLFFITIGLASAQTDNSAAGRNTWHVAGLFSAHYLLPIDEGDYSEEGAFALNVNPLALWFPIDGLGVGVDADFYYFTGHFTDISLGMGPRGVLPEAAGGAESTDAVCRMLISIPGERY
ncbi:hypothetical protein ISS22_04830 [candidate division KSB1 bacterium]|nr:hypothetical protein [candidate division KSB1 bacterium]